MHTLDLETLLIIAGVALLPPILFAAALAGAKRYRREPISALVTAFVWGAVFAAFIASVLNLVVTDSLTARYQTGLVGRFLLLALVVAPVVEETTKAVALPLVRKHADEPVDGLIYGAVAGLGFAASENFLYGLVAFNESGQGGWVLSAAARTFSSTLLHATATAMTGYGLARAFSGRGSWFGVVAWFLGAVLLHSAYNFLATLGAFFGLFGILPVIAIAVWAFTRVRRSIAALSMVAPTTDWRPVGPRRDLPSRSGATRPGPSGADARPTPSWRPATGDDATPTAADDEPDVATWRPVARPKWRADRDDTEPRRRA